MYLYDFRIFAFEIQTGVILGWVYQVEDAFFEVRTIIQAFRYMGIVEVLSQQHG